MDRQKFIDEIAALCAAAEVEVARAKASGDERGWHWHSIEGACSRPVEWLRQS